MQVSGLLFDFDGVLVDSMAMHIRAWCEAVRDLSGQDVSSDLQSRIRGRSTREISRLLSELFAVPASELAASKKTHLLATGIGNVAFPNVELVLKAAASMDIPVAVASNAPRDYVRRTVEECGWHIDTVLGYEDAARPKPFPDLYLMAAKRAGIAVGSHAATLVFEDSTHGIKAGCDAGMKVVGITSSHSDEVLLDAGASHTYPDVYTAATDLGIIP